MLPVVWITSNDRKTAWLVGLAYHCVGSREIAVGIANYHHAPIGVGIFWFGLAVIVQSIPYYLFWSSKRVVSSYVLLLLVSVLPPIGVVAWINPITASGRVFPGFGLWGLVATVLGVMMMMASAKRNKKVFCVLLCGLVVVTAKNYLFLKNPVAPPGIVGLHTQMGGEPKGVLEKFQFEYEKFSAMRSLAKEMPYTTLLLPESAALSWTDTTRLLWDSWRKKLSDNQSVLITSLIPTGDALGQEDNGIIKMSKEGYEIVYRARQAVPVEMWKPFRKGNVRANWFLRPVFLIGDKTAAALICYEASIVMPALQSFLYAPDIVFVSGNFWAAKNTSLLSLHKISVQAWALLFGVDLVFAYNT